MTELYTQFIEQTSQELAQLLLATLPAEHLEQVQYKDQEAKAILRQVGQEAMRLLFSTLADRVTAEAKREGFTIERRPRIRVEVLFGAIEIESPYLWRQGAGRRPVKERLKIEHATRTPAVERALADFGAEESFAQAAQRFEEHYGFCVGASNLMRVVEAVASEAESYLEEKLRRAEAAYAERGCVRRGLSELLVELDGCEIRTARCQTVKDAQTKKILKRVRALEWREVRVGLAGRMDSLKRTFVARLGSYAQVGRDLFRAALIEGWSSWTQVIGVGDGGLGLREELEFQFPTLQFILDKAHLVAHLYETAEALEYEGTKREPWVTRKLEQISAGKVKKVLRELRRTAESCERAGRLCAYLERFQDALFYDRFKAAGYPIGSGEVESAHRYIPQKRLKIPGASWKPETVNSMLALRLIRANGWWREFWQQRQLRFLAA
jgi:hypothetical protein